MHRVDLFFVAIIGPSPAWCPSRRSPRCPCYPRRLSSLPHRPETRETAPEPGKRHRLWSNMVQQALAFIRFTPLVCLDPSRTAQAARLAMAAAPRLLVSPSRPPCEASDSSLEVSLGGPSIELAWRVVHAAETRKALLDARALSLRVRRTIPPPGLNTTFPGGKPHDAVRPPLPSGLPRRKALKHRKGCGGDSCLASHCCR